MLSLLQTAEMVSDETCVQHASHQASLVYAWIYVRQVLPVVTAVSSLQQSCLPDVVCQHSSVDGLHVHMLNT